MSNLLFNIRFGVRHFQISKQYEVSFGVNEYHVKNKPEKYFEIYCLFGRHF